MLIEVTFDQPDQRIDGGGSVRTMGAEMNRRALAELQPHHADDALGIDPIDEAFAPQMDGRGESLGELGQLHRWAGMEPDTVGDEGGAFGGVLGIHNASLTNSSRRPMAPALRQWRGPVPAFRRRRLPWRP